MRVWLSHQHSLCLISCSIVSSYSADNAGSALSSSSGARLQPAATGQPRLRIDIVPELKQGWLS